MQCLRFLIIYFTVVTHFTLMHSSDMQNINNQSSALGRNRTTNVLKAFSKEINKLQSDVAAVKEENRSLKRKQTFLEARITAIDHENKKLKKEVESKESINFHKFRLASLYFSRLDKRIKEGDERSCRYMDERYEATADQIREYVSRRTEVGNLFEDDSGDLILFRNLNSESPLSLCSNFNSVRSFSPQS